MKKYTYTDNQKKTVIFTCSANNILEADELYKKAGHGDPSKQSHVGCSIESNNPLTSH